MNPVRYSRNLLPDTVYFGRIRTKVDSAAVILRILTVLFHDVTHLIVVIKRAKESKHESGY